MFKKLIVLVLFVFSSFTVIAAPPSVKAMRKQMMEREQARAYYSKKMVELQEQNKIFKKSLKPEGIKRTEATFFSKKF